MNTTSTRTSRLNRSRIILLMGLTLLALLLIASCTPERRLPPPPTTPPTAPSGGANAIRIPVAASSPSLGMAYANSRRYNVETPDLLISTNNLFLTPATITFLPGENQKTVVLTARDDFIWKDAWILKQYRSEADKIKPLELTGTLPADVQAQGLRWIEGESRTTLTITRDDFNTADPYKGSLLIFVHTQPGGGDKVQVCDKNGANCQQKDVWLVAVLYIREITDPDDNKESCAAGNFKWVELGGQKNCCHDDPNEIYLVSSLDSSAGCCTKDTDCVFNKACVSTQGGVKKDSENTNFLCDAGTFKDCDTSKVMCSACSATYPFLTTGQSAVHGGYETIALPTSAALWSGEGSGADERGNNPLTISGNVGFATGKIGKAFNFQSQSTANFVRAADSPSLSVTGNGLTLSAWVYPTLNPATGGMGIIHKDGHYSIYRTGDGRLAYADSITWSYATMGYSGSIPINQWTHVAVTFDGTTTRFYINGEEKEPKVRSPASLTDNAQPVVIGGYFTGNALSNPWQGLIDEAEVYNRALSLAEIKQIMANGGAKPECCGDDSNEVKISGTDGSSACCADSTHVVRGGKCIKLASAPTGPGVTSGATQQNMYVLVTVSDAKTATNGEAFCAAKSQSCLKVEWAFKDGCTDGRCGLPLAGTAAVGATIAEKPCGEDGLTDAKFGASEKRVTCIGPTKDPAAVTVNALTLPIPQGSPLSFCSSIGATLIASDWIFKTGCFPAKPAAGQNWCSLDTTGGVFQQFTGDTKPDPVYDGAGVRVLCKPNVPDLDKGLVSHWKLDGGSLADAVGPSSGTGATTLPTPVESILDTSTNVKSALKFTSGSAVNVQYSSTKPSPFRQTKAISYSFWTNIPSGGGGHAMGAGGLNGHGFGGVYLKPKAVSSKSISFQWTPSAPASDAMISTPPLASLDSTEGIPLDTWTHVAVVVNFATRNAQIYLDGKAVTTQKPTATDWTPAASLSLNQGDFFGGRFVTSLQSFVGSLDEIRVYNRELTAEEVQLLAKKPTAPTTTAPAPTAPSLPGAPTTSTETTTTGTTTGTTSGTTTSTGTTSSGTTTTTSGSTSSSSPSAPPLPPPPIPASI